MTTRLHAHGELPFERAIASARRELERAPAACRDHAAAVVELLEQARADDRARQQPREVSPCH